MTRAALDCPVLLWACSGLLGLLWTAVSKFIVVPLRQNACSFWRLENTHPNLPANCCSCAGETPDFAKRAFSCTRNDMCSNSGWLLALPSAALGCFAIGVRVSTSRIPRWLEGLQAQGLRHRSKLEMYAHKHRIANLSGWGVPECAS